MQSSNGKKSDNSGQEPAGKAKAANDPFKWSELWQTCVLSQCLLMDLLEPILLGSHAGSAVKSLIFGWHQTRYFPSTCFCLPAGKIRRKKKLHSFARGEVLKINWGKSSQPSKNWNKRKAPFTIFQSIFFNSPVFLWKSAAAPCCKTERNLKGMGESTALAQTANLPKD